MRLRSTVVAIIVVLLFVTPGSLTALAGTLFEKGPYLILDSRGERVVRVQSAQLQPILEYELSDGNVMREQMRARGHRLFEAKLPVSAMRYRVHSAGSGTTAWKSLHPLPASGQAFRIAVYGDPRVGNGDRNVHRSIVNQIIKERPGLVLIAGDLVGWGDREGLWDLFFEDVAPLIESSPFVAAIGNHDVSKKQLFNRYWRTGMDGNYMALPIAGGWLVVLDSTDDIAEGSVQHAFLVATLKRIRGISPLIVLFHHAPYSGGKHGSNRGIIKSWVPLFEEYGVDVVIAGHDHDYERIGPISGVHYVVSGGGGAPLYMLKDHPWIRASSRSYHYVLFELEGKRLKGWMKNSRGEIGDRFELD